MSPTHRQAIKTNEDPMTWATGVPFFFGYRFYTEGAENSEEMEKACFGRDEMVNTVENC